MIHRTKKEEWRHRRGPKEEKAKSKEEKTTNAEKDWGKQGMFFNIQVSITYIFLAFTKVTVHFSVCITI